MQIIFVKLHTKRSKYGWNEDIFRVGRFTYISIGYRPNGKRYLTREEEEHLLRYNDRDNFIIAFNKIAYNEE